MLNLCVTIYTLPYFLRICNKLYNNTLYMHIYKIKMNIEIVTKY